MAVMGVAPCSSVLVSMVAARPEATRERMRWASAAAATAGVATVGVTAAAVGTWGFEPKSPLKMHLREMKPWYQMWYNIATPGAGKPREPLLKPQLYRSRSMSEKPILTYPLSGAARCSTTTRKQGT